MLTDIQKKKCVGYYNNLVESYLETGNIVYLKKIRLMSNNVKLKGEVIINKLFITRSQYIPRFNNGRKYNDTIYLFEFYLI
jgi:hypothetical protein